jgi:tubulin polyglutamylase TTLL5
MAKRFGTGDFNFLPRTYVLPKQIDEFLDAYQSFKGLWIVKPNASSQGKGIFLLRDLDDIPQSETDVTVISRYIQNPLLIQGLKFDLRIYVLVTSFEPLRAYVYREGLTRFASQEYSTKDEHLRDAYRHLTNYSINKKAENFVENQQAHQDNVGHKWSFSAFNKHLKHTGVDVDLMWERINDLVLKTLIAVKPVIASETRKATAHCANCFELYGFDVLVDEELKPWLVEVNLSPSMLAESPLDMQVKSAVLADTFNLIGVANASWRTLATSKLRSQLLQMRHSMTVASQNAAAFSAGADQQAGPEADDGVRLSELPERDLKMMAQALKEVSRVHNFIRLYPTPKTVTKYAPLMRMPSPTSKLLLQLLLGHDRFVLPEVDPNTSTDASQRECLQKLAPKAQAPSVLNGVTETTEVNDSGEREALPPPEEEEPEEDQPEEDGYLDWTGINSEINFNRAHTTLALQLLKPLNMKASSRIVLIEYLVRMVNLCQALYTDGRAKLAQSKVYKRLSAFRQQLSIFLRTTAKALKQALPPRDDADDDFVDQLIATCKASVACVSQDLWAAASALGCPPQSPEGRREALDMVAHLPPAFAKSSRGEKVVEAVQGLSSGDLEFILQGPDCAPEFASLLGASVRAQERVEEFDELEQMIECCGKSCGPLSELLQAFSEEPDLATPDDTARNHVDQGRSQNREIMEKPSQILKSASVGALPNIFTNMSLMAHAVAACNPRHLSPKAPPLNSLMSSGRSASIIPRLVPPRADILKPNPISKMPALPHTKSLTSLHHPMLSPVRPSFPQSLPSLASSRVGSKQMQRQIRPGNDWMHTDIEF